MRPEHHERVDLAEAARRLGMHPFELARFLGAEGGVPADLRLTEADLAAFCKRAGVESWWFSMPVEDPHRSVALTRSLAWLLLEHAPDPGHATRVDNLYRGLGRHEARLIRKIVNQLIRVGWLHSTWDRRGMVVSARVEYVPRLEELTEGAIPSFISRLWADSGLDARDLSGGSDEA